MNTPNTYTGTIFAATGEVLWTGPLKSYARQSVTAAHQQKALRTAGMSLVGCFRAEITLFRAGAPIHTHHFVYKNGEFSYVEAQPVPADPRGIDLSAPKVSKKAVADVAKSPNSRAAAAQKPGKAVTVAKPDTKLAAKLAKVVKSQAKAAPAPVVEMFSDWMVWHKETCIKAMMLDKPVTREQAQKKATMRYSDPVTVTTVAEGHAKEAAQKASKSISKKPSTHAKDIAKANRKATTPKGAMSEAMVTELAACSTGQPSEGKLGSCMRMHLKMRGMISDMKTGELTTLGMTTLAAQTA